MKLKDIIGSVASKFAALALALTCAGNVWGAETRQVSTLAELTDAITAASAGDTIQLTADVTLEATLEIAKSITLDLNGNTLTKTLATAKDTKPVIKALSGTVEIKNGAITYDLSTYTGSGSTSNANVINVGMNMSNNIYSGGECILTLNGVDVSVTFPKGKMLAMIYVESGKLNIVDSNLSADNVTGNTSAQYMIYTYAGTNTKVNPYVTIEGTTTIDTNGKSGIHAIWLQTENSTLVIGGDSVAITAEAEWKAYSWSSVMSYAYAVNNQSGATCTIEGGKFAGKVWATKGEIIVSGGVFNYEQGTGGQKNKFTLADGVEYVENTDPATKDAYPYKVAPPAKFSYNDFVEALYAGNGTFDGVDAAYSNFPKDEIGRLIVLVEPVGGDWTEGSCTAAWATPYRNNDDGIAQLRLFYSTIDARKDKNTTGVTDVTVENVAFVMNAPDSGSVTGQGTFDLSTVNAYQLYLMNDGNVTFDNCEFDGVGLAVFPSEEKGNVYTKKDNTTIIKGCSFKNIYDYAIKEINTPNYYVTGTTFENCGCAMLVHPLDDGDAGTAAFVGNTFKNIDTGSPWSDKAAGGAGTVKFDIRNSGTKLIWGNNTVENCSGVADTEYHFRNVSGNVVKELKTAADDTHTISYVSSGVEFDAVTPGTIEVAENGTVTWAAPKSYVAQIGTTKYETFAEAIAAVPTTGAETTITMLAGETIVADAGITIAAGKNIVLDLNGQTVQMTAASADERWLIKNEGSLTVKDSAENGKLLMSATGQASTAVRKSTIKNMGSLTVESGTIELTYSGTTKEEPTTILNDASDRATSLTVKGGTVVNSANRGMGVYLAVNDTNATVVDVQGGRVEGYGSAVRYYFDDRALTDAKLTFSMSNGTIHGRGMYGIHGMTTSSKDWNGISFDISGGTISCVGLLGRKHVISPLQGAVSISGGTFNGDVYIYGHYLNITDGNFNGAVTLHRVKESLASASISGGQFKGALTIAETTNENTTNPYYNAKFVSGGIYGTAPAARNVVDGNVVVDNTDSNTQGDYPKAIGGAVASVDVDENTTYYATLADAIAAANEAGVDEITILNGATESPDAAWKVADGKLVRKSYVAQIGTTKYETIDDLLVGLQTAIAGGSYANTITFLADVELADNFVIPQEMAQCPTTFDLNGKHITLATGKTHAIRNYGQLTLVDSVGGGSVTAPIPVINMSGATFNMQGGTLISNAQSGNAVNNDGTFTMAGGSLQVSYAGSSSDSSGPACLYNSGTATITKGTLTSASQRCYAIINSGTGTINPAADSDVAVTGTHGAVAVDGGTVSISGGSYTATNYYALYVSNEASNPTVTVTGGTFDGNAYSAYIGSDVKESVTASVAISGGTFNDPIIESSKVADGSGFAISGGNFTTAVAEDYCATGYIPTAQDSQTGMYTVKTGSYVAQIGTTKYETLAEAIAAVPTTGAETTITMVNNSSGEANVIIAATKNVVLELNGKTVSATAAGGEWHLIVNRGVLTVQDSVGGGAITADGSCSSELSVIYNIGGTLNLVSGTISYTGNWYIGYAVCNSSNAWGVNDDKVAVFNMTGGTISAPSGDAALRVYQNCAAHVAPVSKNYVNISGGTIVDTGIFVDTVLYTDSGIQEGFADSIDTEINISGGTVNGLIDLKIRHKNNTKLNITGGDFTNAKLWVRKKADEYKGDEPTEPMVSISGGKFAFVTGKAFGLAYDCGATSWTSYAKPYEVTGGVFNVDLNNYTGIAFEEGKTGVENTDPETVTAYPYTVGVAVVPVAQIGDEKYATLAEAIDDAQGGDTILLLADATLDEAATVSKNLTITLDGHSITGTITAGAGYELVTSDTAYVVRGAGYAGEVLPAGPDMSGDVINVTAANAQYTLDGAYGDINGKTINFTESIAAVLELCRATKYEGSGTSYKIGYNTDNLPLPWSEENIATIKAHNGMMTYYRTVSNIVFTANQGVTLQGFAFTNGYHETGKYDFAREITVNDSGFDDKYVNLTSLNNITFEDLTFNGNVAYSVDVYHRGLESTSVSGITFNGCSFANTSAAAIHMLNDENTAYIDNTVVSNCTFTSVHQGVYVNKPNGATIVDNYFYGTGHNAIAMQSDNNSASRAGGDITIIGNYATGVGDRVVRFNYVGADANITINNNVFLKTAAATASESDVIKGTDIASGATVDLEYTYWNGATTSDAIKGAFTPFLPTNTGINSGTWKVDVSDYVAPGYAATDNGDGTWTVAQAATPVAQIGDVTYTTLAAAIDAAEEYKAEHDEYPTITVLDADAAAAELDAASDWKISGDELVRKNVIATLAQGGALVGKYEDLHVALEAGKAVGSVVTLLVDVDLDGVTWVPVADFAGTFDGNNKTISNLTINDNTLYPAGLFSVTGYGATIKNLTLDDPTVIGGKENIGALVGKLWASTVTNCHVTGAITVSGYHCVGGLTGFADYSQVVDCSIVGDSKATASVVGIYDDDIEDGDNVGGLIGMGGTASPLYSSIEVMEPKDLDKEATIGCTVRNITVKGTRKVGGLVGQIYSTCSVSNVVVSSVNVTTTATEDFASKKSGTMGVGGMAGMFVFYTDSNTGKYGRIGQFAGKVSDVNVTSENAAVDAYAWMGVISGGQRDASADFVIPQGLTFAVTVKGKNLTTGAHVTDNTTAIYSAKPVTCSVTFDLGTNYPTGAEKPADGAYAVGEELPLPNYESANTSFAGWKVSGEGDAISTLPAGTTGDITLVATWMGAKSIQIDAGGKELTTIKVTDEWLEANNLTGADTDVIRAALEEKADNGVPAWENYVLGQSIDAAVSSGAEQGETTLMPVTSTIDVPAADTGFDVKYRLDTVNADGDVVAAGTAQATPDLALELSGVAGSAYYRLAAVVAAKDGSGASVSVQANNTIGVLAVNSSAKSMIVAVPWASLDDGRQISVSNLVRTATLSEGDELKVYDPNTGTYKVWTLNSSKEWEPNTTVTESGSSLAPSADEYSVPRGAGVWLTRTDTTQPIYLVGEVAEQSTTTTIAGAQGNEPTWNLVAAPTVEAVNLNVKFPNANEGDVVLVPTDGAPKRYTYKDGSWGYDEYVTTVNKRGIEVVKVVRNTDVTKVPIGTGFWYMNAGDAKNVEW